MSSSQIYREHWQTAHVRNWPGIAWRDTAGDGAGRANRTKSYSASPIARNNSKANMTAQAIETTVAIDTICMTGTRISETRRKDPRSGWKADM